MTVSLLTGAVCIVVAIVRLQFLDVRFIVRRGLVYGLASGVIVAVYLFAGKQMDRLAAQLVGTNLPVFETTFLVLSLFLLQPVLANIEAFVDRAYSARPHRSSQHAEPLSEEISLLLDPSHVRERVAGTLCREMVLKNAAVVSLDRLTRAFPLARAGREAVTEASWSAGPSLFRALHDRRDPVSARELGELPKMRTNAAV